MQLLLILALLLYGGRGDGGKLLNEFRPVLETFGGDEIKSALKNAEELRQVISAFSGMQNGGSGACANSGGEGSSAAHSDVNSYGYGDTAEHVNYNSENSGGLGADGSVNARGGQTGNNFSNNACGDECGNPSGKSEDGFLLAPIADIADKEILYRLVRFFSEPSRAV